MFGSLGLFLVFRCLLDIYGNTCLQVLIHLEFFGDKINTLFKEFVCSFDGPDSFATFHAFCQRSWRKRMQSCRRRDVFVGFLFPQWLIGGLGRWFGFLGSPYERDCYLG